MGIKMSENNNPQYVMAMCSMWKQKFNKAHSLRHIWVNVSMIGVMILCSCTPETFEYCSADQSLKAVWLSAVWLCRAELSAYPIAKRLHVFFNKSYPIKLYFLGNFHTVILYRSLSY